MTRKSISWMCAALVVAGFGIFSANTASAGWGIGPDYRSIGFQNQRYGYQNSCLPRYGNSNYGYQDYGYSRNRGFTQPRYNTFNNYNSRSGRYLDPTHYDYHPPTAVRHGNHLDYTPGRYDLHRSGRYNLR